MKRTKCNKMLTVVKCRLIDNFYFFHILSISKIFYSEHWSRNGLEMKYL